MAISRCDFDRLFTISVPHILEKIFFALDFDSFMECSKVCKAWNELYLSELYHRKAEELMIEKKCNEQRLCTSSLKGDIEEVHNLLTMGVNPNCGSPNGGPLDWSNPLYIAASHRHQHVVEMLLRAGANPVKVNVREETMLHWAARYHYGEVVEILLEGGVEIDTANKRGHTPLAIAASKGDDHVVEMLLEAGANPNKEDNNGETPLYGAAFYDHVAVVKLLIVKGADINKANKMGNTPLHISSANGSKSVVKILLDEEADNDEENDHGYTPLVYAIVNGYEQIVRLLREAGADLTKANNSKPEGFGFPGNNLPIYLPTRSDWLS